MAGLIRIRLRRKILDTEALKTKPEEKMTSTEKFYLKYREKQREKCIRKVCAYQNAAKQRENLQK